MTAPPIFTTFRFYRGATFSTEPIIVDNPDGTAVDLTGYTGTLQIWREDDDPLVDDPLYELTSPSGGLVITALTGTVVGTIDAAGTAIDVDIDGESWPFKLTLTNTNPTPDTVERLVQGFVVAQQ